MVSRQETVAAVLHGRAWALSVALATFFCCRAIAAEPPPTANAPDLSVLRAQSAAISKADRAKAKQLFATAFTLWQSGNFAAAELAFEQGLDIDPANALANYYYGDCLAHRKDKADAKRYLARAASLGAGSTEGFEAQAELQQLSLAPTDVADMTQDEIDNALIGHWRMTIACSWGSGDYDLDITTVTNGKVFGPKSLGWGGDFDEGDIDGGHILLRYDVGDFDGMLAAPKRLDGSVISGRDLGCHWTAQK